MSESEAKKWLSGEKWLSEVKGLVTRLDGLEERLNGLETRIDERFKESEQQRNERFDAIETRLASIDESLKKLDEDIRGNGKDGLNARLHHVEKMQKIFLWVGGMILTAFVAHYLGLIEQLKNLAFAG